MSLSPSTLIIVIVGYFLVLMSISYMTGREGDNQSFFTAKRKSPWLLVAIGMIGASLSGATFISIPGVVGAGGLNQSFSYMQVVFGYLVGYLVIATVLMPAYYRMNLTTIYEYLKKRFGVVSYKTGSFYFLLSRIIGASFRLFLVSIVLQKFIMDAYGIPFWMTVAITIILIWVYTYKGGIKTIVWTDTLQTVCMLSAVLLTISAILQGMDLGLADMISTVRQSDYAQMFFFEGGWQDGNNFYKQFTSGALIAIVMTGLDQDMMQKNLTCKTLGDAQKNMFTFSFILIFANLLFLSLGALMYIYADHIGMIIPTKTDQLYPTLALEHLSPFIGIVFLLGLIAAAYSSADSALTALTTSFCIDFLNFNESTESEAVKKKKRLKVHVGFSFILFAVIIIFKALNNDAIINALFVVSGYTYGPILGLFSFGMMTKRVVMDKYVLAVCLAAPIISYVLDKNSEAFFNGFKFGFLTLALNGLLTFIGLWIISKSQQSTS